MIPHKNKIIKSNVWDDYRLPRTGKDGHRLSDLKRIGGILRRK